jgi:hypothetical protein
MSQPKERYSTNLSTHDADEEPSEGSQSKHRCCEGSDQRLGMHYLPPEIVSMILSVALDDDHSECVLHQLLPDEKLCQRGKELIEDDQTRPRIVTYVKGEMGEAGKFSVKERHGEGDHIFLPLKRLDGKLSSLSRQYFRELVDICYSHSLVVFNLKVSAPLPHQGNEELDKAGPKIWNLLRPLLRGRVRSILPNILDAEPSSTELEKLPFCERHVYTRIRHIAFHSPLSLLELDAQKLFGNTSLNAAETMALDYQVDLDRRAHLWISWSLMPQLESVLLDLRAYSSRHNTEQGWFGRDEVIASGQEMGRHLRLKLLVIAGLQSNIFEADYEEMEIEEIETVDELGAYNDPNWIKVFRKALRPGGKLILVDRVSEASGSTG